MAARSRRRNCLRASSKRLPGCISTSREQRSARRRPTSTRAGARAGACGCSTNSSKSTTSDEPASMTEVVFYHLVRKPLEKALPELLEKSYERGWRVVVQASSEERVDALDAHLWTYNDSNFLPHGTARDGDAALHPILLTTAEHNPNGATVRFLIDGAPIPEDAD